MSIFSNLSGTAKTPAEQIQEQLDAGHELLPFPQSVGKLLAALKDPDVTTAALSTIIEVDAGLTLRLLRMANSPVFGSSNGIQSVARATTVLGIGKLRTIALMFAASSAFSSDGPAQQQKERLWFHSLGCATNSTCRRKTWWK